MKTTANLDKLEGFREIIERKVNITRLNEHDWTTKIKNGKVKITKREEV